MSALFKTLPEESRGILRAQAQPHWVEASLATLVHQPFSDPDWLFEPKLDGQRCLIFRHDNEVRLMSRNQKRLDDTYPELIRAFAEQSDKNLILDGEIVAFENGISDFAQLQQRMKVSGDHGVQQVVPIYCYLFDVLHADGYDTRVLPLRERKKVLAQALDFQDPLRETPYENADGESYYNRACRAGWEGALAKEASSTYVRGRSRTWLKLKCLHQQEFVIGGFTEPAGGRPALGALLIGYYEGRRFVYGGKVGTGFDNDTLRELRQGLDKIERDRSPFADDVTEHGVHWVEPELVANVSFTEWTGDGKLRHPSYVGLRRDKDPAEVTRERPA